MALLRYMEPSRCLPDPKGSMSFPSQAIAESNKEVQKAMQFTKRGPHLQLSPSRCKIAEYAGHHGAAAVRHYFRDNEQTREIIIGRWPMVFPSFLTATAYLSCVRFVAPFRTQEFLLQQPARLPRKRGSHKRTNLVHTRPP